MFRSSALVISLAVALLTSAANAQPTTLGRFFSTPEQRTALDRARTELLMQMELDELSLREVENTAVTDDAPDLILHMGGSLRHADGTHTIWLNGTAFDERNLPEGYSLVQSGPLTSLRVEGNNAVYLLRPGQTLYTAEGIVREQPFAELVTTRPSRPAGTTGNAASAPDANNDGNEDDSSDQPIDLEELLPRAQQALEILSVLSTLQENL
jgi:hypothetical protein